MGRYGRYWITLAMAVLLVWVGNLLAGPTHGGIFWPIAGYSSVLVFVSVWGLGGVALSSPTRRAEGVAGQGVVGRWHYQLSTLANANTEPRSGISRCEYWARLCHGLSTTFWVSVVLTATLPVFAGVVWLFGARPNLDRGDFFKEGHQADGPIVLALTLLGLAIWGLTAVPGGFWAAAYSDFSSDIRMIGKGVGGLIALVFAVVGGKFILAAWAGIVALRIVFLSRRRFLLPLARAVLGRVQLFFSCAATRVAGAYHSAMRSAADTVIRGGLCKPMS